MSGVRRQTATGLAHTQAAGAPPRGWRRRRSTGLCVIVLAAALIGVAARAEPVPLDECVRLALARAPMSRAAAAEAQASAERVRAAAGAYMPRFLGQADYGVSGGYDEAVTNGGLTAAVVAVQLPLLDGGLRRANLEAARSRLQSATALEQQRRADVVFSVREAYLAGVAAQAEAAIQADAVRALEDYVALLRAQEARGFIPRTDVLRAEVALQTARSSERAATATATAGARVLGELTGSIIDAADLVPPPSEAYAPPAADGIESSPAVVDAHAQARAAHQDANAARSEWRPQLTLNADAGFMGVKPDNTFRDNGGGEFLLGFSVPIYDGGVIKARIAAAEAMAASADASVDQARQSVAIALARVQIEAERARADRVAWDRTVPQAADGFQLMRARYFGGGNVRLLEVLDALAQLADARVAAVRAQLAYDVAVATQDQLLGVIP